MLPSWLQVLVALDYWHIVSLQIHCDIFCRNGGILVNPHFNRIRRSFGYTNQNRHNIQQIADPRDNTIVCRCKNT